jgi:chromate reductase, NAD(P)H dehydrogenase (quinone)
MNDSTIKILALAGSLREGSLNRQLLDAAIDLAPEGVEIEVADIGRLPHYDDDLESLVVRGFKERIADADALLFVSPEFNWSIPGVLKNAIDWASRPGGSSPLAGKPAAIMGVSPGPAGTGRMQMHLREVLLSTRTHVLMNSLQVANGREHFDAGGNLTDEAVADSVRGLLHELSVAVGSHERHREAVAV